MLPPLFARPPADPPRSAASAGWPPPATHRRVGCSASIITLSWDGAQVGQIAAQLSCHPRTVYRWRHRFNAGGLDDLGHLPRSGRPRRLGELERGRIIALVSSDPSGRLHRQPDGTLAVVDDQQAAQWTLNALAAAQAEGIAVSRSQVRRILISERVRWRRTRSWATSTDPDFAPKDSHARVGAATDENGPGPG